MKPSATWNNEGDKEMERTCKESNVHYQIGKLPASAYKLEIAMKEWGTFTSTLSCKYICIDIGCIRSEIIFMVIQSAKEMLVECAVNN